MSSVAAHQNDCQMWMSISECEIYYGCVRLARHARRVLVRLMLVSPVLCVWSKKKSGVCREFPTLELGADTPR